MTTFGPRSAKGQCPCFPGPRLLDADGKELVSTLRSFGDLAIIVISARHQGSEKVAAVDAGADDYVDKPFEIEELMARIRVAERSLGSTKRKPEVLGSGDLTTRLRTTFGPADGR